MDRVAVIEIGTKDVPVQIRDVHLVIVVKRLIVRIVSYADIGYTKPVSAIHTAPDSSQIKVMKPTVWILVNEGSPICTCLRAVSYTERKAQGGVGVRERGIWPAIDPEVGSTGSAQTGASPLAMQTGIELPWVEHELNESCPPIANGPLVSYIYA